MERGIEELHLNNGGFFPRHCLPENLGGRKVSIAMACSCDHIKSILLLFLLFFLTSFTAFEPSYLIHISILKTVLIKSVFICTLLVILS